MLQKTDNTPIFLLDDSGIIMECNKQACELGGYSCDEIVEKHFSDILLSDSKAMGVLAGETNHFITRFIRKDGYQLTVIGIMNSFTRQKEKLHYLTLFDVTSGNLINQSEENENIKLLAGYIAHDLNNILTGIMGSLSLLKEGVDSAILYDELLANAEDGAFRARDITNQILAYSRGEISSVFGIDKSDFKKTDHFNSKSDQDSGKLLLLEDNNLVAETARGMLNTLGYSVDIVKEGEDAIEKFKKALQLESPYDVVILDKTIEGGMDGVTTVKFLLNLDPSAVVIITSGFANDDVIKNHQDYGFKGCLTKPYTVRELYESLCVALDT